MVSGDRAAFAKIGMGFIRSFEWYLAQGLSSLSNLLSAKNKDVSRVTCLHCTQYAVSCAGGVIFTGLAVHHTSGDIFM